MGQVEIEHQQNHIPHLVYLVVQRAALDGTLSNTWSAGQRSRAKRINLLRNDNFLITTILYKTKLKLHNYWMLEQKKKAFLNFRGSLHTIIKNECQVY